LRRADPISIATAKIARRMAPGFKQSRNDRASRVLFSGPTGKARSLIMRRIVTFASAVALMAGLGGAGHAAPISIPPASSTSGYLAVADMEMMVSSQTANLRAKPATNAKIIEKLPRGTKVTVLDKASSHWAHVKVNDKEGYIDMKLLK
jgi:uncharacterized protein YgiM (DUF1202 family)